MRKIAFAIAVLGLVSCGGTKTVYVVNTDAPETTEKVVTTTKAPVRTSPPQTMPPRTWSAEDEFLIDVRANYYGTIYVSDQDMIDTAQTVCLALRTGSSAEDVLYAIVGAGGDTDFLVSLSAAAVVNFCPEQAWKFESL